MTKVVPRLGAAGKTVDAKTIGVEVTVEVTVGVPVCVGVAVAVGELVLVRVEVTVGVLVPVAVWVAVLVIVGVPGVMLVVDVKVGVSAGGDDGPLLLLQPAIKATGNNAINTKLPIIFFTFTSPVFF